MTWDDVAEKWVDPPHARDEVVEKRVWDKGPWHWTKHAKERLMTRFGLVPREVDSLAYIIGQEGRAWVVEVDEMVLIVARKEKQWWVKTVMPYAYWRMTHEKTGK